MTGRREREEGRVRRWTGEGGGEREEVTGRREREEGRVRRWRCEGGGVRRSEGAVRTRG